MAEYDIDKEIKAGMKSFGQDIVLAIAAVLRRLDKRAAGKLISSLNYELITLVQNVNYILEVEGEAYFDVVDQGRKPNSKQPPLSKIEQWTKHKGIDIEFAYPIAKRIGKFGIPPTNALREALKQIDFKQLESELDKIFIAEIQKQIDLAA